MAFDDHTYKWIVRETLGSSIVKNEKDVLKFVAGYTKYKQMPAAASVTAVLNAAAGSSAGSTTVTTGITNPDVPRVLTAKGSATAAGTVRVTGLNVEGKTITDSFILAGASTITGLAAFKTVTSVFIPTQVGASGTVSIGTSNKLGLYHRLEPGQFGMRVVLDTTSAATSLNNQTFDAAPTVVTSDLVEYNVVTPVTTPDGATWFRIYYYITRWSLNDQDTNEQYSTTTSTSSTSSSTSTTTLTTSTSSTSVSSTSSSTSSTSSSISTSSTSTSTSTLP